MSEIAWATQSFVDDPGHATLLQDLIDISAPRTKLTRETVGGGIGFFCPLGCRHWSRSHEWPWVITQGDVKSRDVVLEAGGGDTELQFLLARRACRVVNFDHDQGSLDAAEMQARQLGISNLLCRRGDLAEKIYYPDNYFDKVFCVSVVEHIENVEECVEELQRVLKPGGRLLLTMDIAEHRTGQFAVDNSRATQLIAQWGMKLPPFPDDGLRQAIDEKDQAGEPHINYLTALCVRVDKPQIS